MYKLNDRTPHTRNIDVHAYVSAASRIFSSRSGLAARSASVTVRTLAGNTKLYTTCRYMYTRCPMANARTVCWIYQIHRARS